MCAICQNGPAILGGVPVAGLAIARLRQRLGRGNVPAEPPQPDATPEQGAQA